MVNLTKILLLISDSTNIINFSASPHHILNDYIPYTIITKLKHNNYLISKVKILL